MKTFVNQNRNEVAQINVPFNVNNELQLFTERFAEMQSTFPQFSPNFKKAEYNDENYFTITIWDSGLERYLKANDLLQIQYYIEANSTTN